MNNFNSITMGEIATRAQAGGQSRLRIVECFWLVHNIKLGDMEGRRDRLHDLFPDIKHDDDKPTTICLANALKQKVFGRAHVCVGLDGINVSTKFMEDEEPIHVIQLMEIVSKFFDVTVSKKSQPDFHFEDEYEYKIHRKIAFEQPWWKFTFVNETERDVRLPRHFDEFGDIGFVVNAANETKINVCENNFVVSSFLPISAASELDELKDVTESARSYGLLFFPCRYGSRTLSMTIPKGGTVTLVACMLSRRSNNCDLSDRVKVYCAARDPENNPYTIKTMDGEVSASYDGDFCVG